MGSHYQSATLVASPSYPNSIAWSEENLVAIASGHIITIINPALLAGPRGLITLPPNKPIPIGVVQREELLAPCVMPVCLSRDIRPCARSISWSPQGFAPNSGCLLAVCTTEGRVKLYRPPFCEYSSEWVEVMDISDLLYAYLDRVKFGEVNVPSAMSTPGQDNAGCIKEGGSFIKFQNSVSNKVTNPRKKKPIRRTEDKRSNYEGSKLTHGANMDHQIGNGGLENKSGESQLGKRKEDGVLPLITAREYSSRRAMLSSLIVSWSPLLYLPGISPLNCLSSGRSLLAVGGKSGNISFWIFCQPKCYSIEQGSDSVDAMFIGLLQAHNSWITAISWGICTANSSESQLILATGSCDGSVKVWLADVEGLVKSSDTGKALFSLLKEVNDVTNVPISVISLVVPVKSEDKILLAVGKGSGLLEAWICHISSKKLQSAGIYNAHDQVVTGLAWAFDGCCLYSCSQDNSLRSWVLHGSCLYEVPFPSNFHGLVNSGNLLQVTDLCFGLALSPGELMVAVVRSFDASLLNQMYQARTQKAVIEFFWTGGQLLKVSSEHQECSPEVFYGLSERDLECWESNIIRSLKSYHNLDKVLVLWDVIESLLIFKKSTDNFLENILSKWISSWFSDYQYVSIEKMLANAQSMLSKISSRKMHLLNIICRRLILNEAQTEVSNGEQHMVDGFSNEGKLGIWNELLVGSERELRERLVAITFKAILGRVTCLPTVSLLCTNWSPVGVARMKQWVIMNLEEVHDQLRLLLSILAEKGSSIDYMGEIETESCDFCSALVRFENPETAWCGECHRLQRCAVSMQLCPVTIPLWLCVCCQRSAAKLPPETFFNLSKSPLNADYATAETFSLRGRSKPNCPFCGILLQRLLPDFLLSANPV